VEAAKPVATGLAMARNIEFCIKFAFSIGAKRTEHDIKAFVRRHQFIYFHERL
jgi:hypothetical protein